MGIWYKSIIVWLVLLVWSATAGAQDKVVRLTSLEWPPYTGAALYEQGASAAVARAAFKAVGYTLVIDFFPWSRAVDMARSDPAYLGYFPEYHAADTAKQFLYSEPIGIGPLGLAENAEAPVVWQTLDDLAKYRIGVVQDYVNTEAFDQRVAKKQQKVDVTVSDLQNLQKLGDRRIDLAVIDQHVFQYLLGTSAKLRSAKDKLRFNAKILEDKKLYICFKRSPEGEKMAKLFQEGLRKIDANAIMARYLQTLKR